MLPMITGCAKTRTRARSDISEWNTANVFEDIETVTLDNIICEGVKLCGIPSLN